MLKRKRAISLPIILISSVFLLVALQSNAFALRQKQTNERGIAQILGPIQVDAMLTDTTNAPGSTVDLHLNAISTANELATPHITITLPEGITLNPAQLPLGTTFNLQTNQLSWQPVLAPSDSRQLSITLQITEAAIATPNQTVEIALLYAEQEQFATIDYWVGSLPTISMMVNPLQASVGQPIQLTANISHSEQLTQTWDFGDGRQITADNPTVVYPLPGNYQVILKVTNPAGTVQTSGFVTVVEKPNAHFFVPKSAYTVGEPILFTNKSSGALPLTYSWEFGDGTSSNEFSPSHSYETPGTYVVTLNTYSPYGHAQATWPLHIGSRPTAELNLPLTARAGEPFSGDALTDATTTGVSWDMGDGTVYNGHQMQHTYKSLGDFYVSMTAANEFGSTNLGQWISVLDGQLFMYYPLMVSWYQNDMDNPSQEENAPLDTALEEYGDTTQVVTVTTPEPHRVERVEFAPGITPPEQLLWYINEARRLHNLHPVHYVYEMSLAAQQHTNDMAVNHFRGHTGADGSTPDSRLRENGYSGSYIGEATGWGISDPAAMVEFWLNSPSHRKILLHQLNNEIGIGFTIDYNSDSIWYWTVEMGVRYLIYENSPH